MDPCTAQVEVGSRAFLCIWADGHDGDHRAAVRGKCSFWPHALAHQRAANVYVEWKDRKHCPDGGACHHECSGGCFRVAHAEPLSGVYRASAVPELGQHHPGRSIAGMEAKS